MIPAYEIATRISLQGNVQSVLAVLAKDVLQLEGGVNRLAKAFEGMGRAAKLMTGGLMIAGGIGGISILKKLADDAKELSHELVQIQKLGVSQGQFSQAKGAAFALPGQVPGITSVDAAKIYGQIYSPLGHENALKMMKPLAEFTQVLGNTTGDYKGASDKVYEMVRAGDLMGKFMNKMTHEVDIGGLTRFLDLGGRVIQATHGKVDANTWFQMAQTAGPALSQMSDQGLMTMAMVAQMMKGPRAGTALMSLFSQMQGGIMTQWRAKLLQDMGFVGGFTVNKGGHLTWDNGALETPFTQALRDDPLNAIKMLQGGLSGQGYKTIDQQVPMLYQLFQRQTTIREIHDLLRNMPQLEQERGRIAGGLGTSTAANLQNSQDYVQVMHNLDAAWKDLLMHVGGPLAMAAIPVLKSLTAALRPITEWAQTEAGTNAITNIGKGFAALSAALIGGGAAAILAALGPAGWIAAGIIGLGGVCIAWKDKIQEGVLAFSDAIRSIGTTIWNFVKTFGGLYNPTSFGGGGIGGGGMYHRASLGGGGAFVGAGSRSSGLGGGVSGEYTSLINKLGGADAHALNSIYGTEGFSGYVGDHGTSFGPFQLHRGGPGSAGYIFEKSTGLNLADRSTVPAQIEFMRKWGKQYGGWSSNVWHGLRDKGIGSLRRPSEYHRQNSGGATHIENVIHLDGQVVHRSVFKRAVAAAEHVRSAPYHDGSRMWGGPDMNLVPV